MTVLSILIPSIPSRIDKMKRLFDRLQAQVDVGKYDVEVLSFLDNKKRSVGLKRDALVQLAQGKYCAFVDDDDEVYDCYVHELAFAAKARDVDVIVFNEHCTINNGNIFTVRFGLEYPNEEAHMVKGRWADVTRKPWHPCAWRTSIAQSERFSDASYGEDWHWCKRLIPKAKTQHRINAVISRYDFNNVTTEAAHVFPKD
jgi:glycosyltransferase involved in cell wall biosynthesis